MSHIGDSIGCFGQLHLQQVDEFACRVTINQLESHRRTIARFQLEIRAGSRSKREPFTGRDIIDNACLDFLLAGCLPVVFHCSATFPVYLHGQPRGEEPNQVHIGILPDVLILCAGSDAGLGHRIGCRAIQRLHDVPA